MINDIIQCATAFTGSLAFCFLFNIRGRNMLYAGFCGLVAWIVYLLFRGMFETDVLQYFFAAAAFSFMAEFFARSTKTPVTVFLIIGMIPLVPGALIYYAMEDFVRGNYGSFASRCLYTIKIGGAIAMGILVVTATFRIITGLMAKSRD